MPHRERSPLPLVKRTDSLPRTDLSLRNTVLVTGSSSGIGHATVERFAASDWAVAATVRSPDASPEWSSPPTMTRYPLDVTTEDQIREAIQGFSESLQCKLRPLGIDVKVVEPGTVRTNLFDAVWETDVDDLPDYQPYQDTVLANLTELNDQGATPESVADVIFEAATDRGSSQLRYKAGSDVSVFLLLRKLIPDRLFFWLVRSHLEPSD